MKYVEGIDAEVDIVEFRVYHIFLQVDYFWNDSKEYRSTNVTDINPKQLKNNKVFMRCCTANS